MRVGVIGGGIQGICTALEFSRRGAEVHLFDRHPSLMCGASRENEGKIHLGFVYANDPSFATVRLMSQAALCFAPLLREYLERDLSFLSRSDPFVYAVHVDSLVSADELECRYDRIAKMIRTMSTIPGSDYFRQRRPHHIRRWTNEELQSRFHCERIQGAFETNEIAVDPRELGDALRSRVLDDPKITVRASTEVNSIQIGPRSVRLEIAEAGVSPFSPLEILAEQVDFSLGIGPRGVSEHGDCGSESFDQVINCAWDGRLLLDRTAGVPLPKHWSFRRKHFVRIPATAAFDSVQSTTVVLGGFGDIVRYSGGDVFLFWYPVGCRGIETGLSPSKHDAVLDDEEQRAMRDGIVAGLRDLVFDFDRVPDEIWDRATVSNGIIFALGNTDVSDPQSKLHFRHQTGPRSYGRYHTIDTGKYTTAPLFARSLAQSISCLEKVA